MGQCCARDNKTDRPGDIAKGGRTRKHQKVTNKEEFNPGQSEFVVENKNKITREYNVLSPALGRGAFGEVRQAIHRETGMVRAIKIVFKESSRADELKRIVREVEILKKLDHPNIIKVFEFFQDDRHFYIVTELCTGGELFDRIIKKHHFSEKEAAETMHQILSAIVYCHENKIVHRDLKPENILLESSKEDSPIKVIDFGTSKVYDPSSKMVQRLGTPYYIAPEVLEKRYDEKCDVWSCGVILYIILTGVPPFNGKNDEQIMEKVSNGSYSFNIPEFDNVSSLAKKLIKKMLEYSPSKRVSAYNAINDDWFQTMRSNEAKQINLSTLNNLRKLNYKSKLQQAIYYFIVTHMATKEEKSDLMRVFKQLDKNGDGKLDREELKHAYDSYVGISEEEINRMVDKLDNDKSGVIDYSEFVAAAIDREKLLTKQRIEACFKLFDKDKSGGISSQELKIMFGGTNVEDGVWGELIQEVDDDENGEIEYAEFKDMLIKLIDN